MFFKHFTVFCFVLIMILPTIVMATHEKDATGIVSDMNTNTIANDVQGLGVGWVRITAYWRLIETSKGVYNWTAIDGQINRATTRNLKMFITIHSTPSWAGGGANGNLPPTNSVDFGDFCFAIANRYKTNSLVKAYGMWNEPNLSGFWNGTRAQYQSKILVPGSQKIHQAKSTLLVAAPELQHNWTSGSNWALGTLLDTAGAQIDVATVHFYPDWSPLDNGFENYLDNYVKPSRRGKPVWISEVGRKGCSNDFCTLDLQAHYYSYILYTRLARASWFQRVFPFQIWESQGTCNGIYGWEITYGSGHIRKPAYRTFSDYIAHLGFFDPYPECHPAECPPHDPDCWPPPQ